MFRSNSHELPTAKVTFGWLPETAQDGLGEDGVTIVPFT